MKVFLITDVHYGVRNDSVAFLDMTKQFMDNVFFPELDKRGIKCGFHLGDLLDRRKYTNTYTAKRLREDFIDPMLSRGINFINILGNHDTYYKTTNDVNSVTELFGDMFPTFKNAQTIEVDKTKILLVPWICPDNREQSLQAIEASDADICLGHLELLGFEMFKGSLSTHGDDPKIFSDKFAITCSGHFHHRSYSSGIHYLGSHGQFTWSDYGDTRGFHILDTETKELEFIENPYRMFSKLFYSDEGKTLDEVTNVDFTKFAGTFCKVVVKTKTNPYWFDMYCNKLDKAGLIDYQIVEDHKNVNLEEDYEIVSEAESTINICRKYIQQIDTSTISKDKLENFVVQLYNEAQGMVA